LSKALGAYLYVPERTRLWIRGRTLVTEVCGEVRYEVCGEVRYEVCGEVRYEVCGEVRYEVCGGVTALIHT